MTIESRNLADPRALRALAHPVRLQMLEYLQIDGPLTATELSERIDESPANCSWHLRQLAQHGLVEEAGGGQGRQRPWRVRIELQNFGAGDEETAVAAAAATTAIRHRDLDALNRWQTQRRGEPENWRDAAFDLGAFLWLTAAELHEIQNIVTEVVLRFAQRGQAEENRPPDARPVRMVTWATPVGPTERANDNSSQDRDEVRHPRPRRR